MHVKRIGVKGRPWHGIERYGDRGDASEVEQPVFEGPIAVVDDEAAAYCYERGNEPGAQ